MSNSTKCPACGGALPSRSPEGLCPACLLREGAQPPSGSDPRAGSFQPPGVAEIAPLFPKLELMELIGRGGMGAIYKARQPALDRWVALKLLPGQPTGGPDFTARFNREARALARLSHPNIVAVHEVGQVEGFHYFIMEFVDGVNLRQLQRAGRLSPREALQIIPQICDALQYAHDEGVVHRDIKPENVLVDRKGRVKVADFGLAKLLDLETATSRLTAEGQVMGTPHYMAPEQIEHPLEVDHRADIYALGVVFYELLTGELPLGKFAPPSRKVPVDVRLDEVVLRTLEKEPEQRYQQAGEVKTNVEQIVSTPPVQPVSLGSEPGRAAAHPGQTASSRRTRMKVPLLAGLGVFALMLILPLAALFNNDRTYMASVRLDIQKSDEDTIEGFSNFDPYFVQTEFEKILSMRVATNVVARLDLNERWAGREGEETMSLPDAASKLLQRMKVRQSRNTSLVEIQYYDASPREAAEIANAIAETYSALGPAKVRIVDRAEMAQKPVRPHPGLLLMLAGMAGAGLAVLTVAAVALIRYIQSRSTPTG